MRRKIRRKTGSKWEKSERWKRKMIGKRNTRKVGLRKRRKRMRKKRK